MLLSSTPKTFSLKVKVTSVLSPIAKTLSAIAMLTVGAIVSTVICNSLGVLSLPAISVKLPLRTLNVAFSLIPCVGVKVAV